MWFKEEKKSPNKHVELTVFCIILKQGKFSVCERGIWRVSHLWFLLEKNVPTPLENMNLKKSCLPSRLANHEPRIFSCGFLALTEILHNSICEIPILIFFNNVCFYYIHIIWKVIRECSKGLPPSDPSLSVWNCSPVFEFCRSPQLLERHQDPTLLLKMAP